MAAPNRPQDLPDYVRFSPKSHEVILLLKRFIRKEPMLSCAVKVSVDGDLRDTVFVNQWNSARYPYFEKDEYWFFLHRKPAKDKKKVDRRLGDLGTWTARGKSTNIYFGAQLVGIKQKYELMKGKVRTGWSQFEYTRFSNKFEKICVSHLIFAKPEVNYPSDISEEEVEEAPVDEEEQRLVNEEQLLNLEEEAPADEPVINLEDAAADEEEQRLVNEEQLLNLEEEAPADEPVINVEDAAADDDWEWTHYLNTEEDGLTVDELFGDGESEKTLEHVNEEHGVLEPVDTEEEEAAAAEEEQTVQAHEEQGALEPVVKLGRRRSF